MPLFASAATATATQSVVADTEEKWLEFADQKPKHSTDFLLKKKETGDLRIGNINKFKGWEEGEYWEAFFLTYRVEKTNDGGKVVEERDWKEWSWRYDD